MRVAVAVALVPLAAFTAGCQSTQSKSAELEAQAGEVTQQKGLKIAKRSRDVKATHATLLSDRNGTAAVVELKNTTKKTLVQVPVAIDVLDRGKKTFSNDAPGLDPALVGVSVLRPGESLAWVNDQVLVPGSKLEPTVGATTKRPPKELPKIDVGPPKLGGDPTSGIAIEGTVANRSQILQRKLVIYAVARKDGRVVAAGRGQVERLKPGKSSSYQIFFIGNPEGATVELAAPPTTFE